MVKNRAMEFLLGLMVLTKNSFDCFIWSLFILSKKYFEGDKYEGEWKDEKKDGKGKFCYSNGDIYEGGFLDNQKHGFGIYKWADGIK